MKFIRKLQDIEQVEDESPLESRKKGSCWFWPDAWNIMNLLGKLSWKIIKKMESELSEQVRQYFCQIATESTMQIGVTRNVTIEDKCNDNETGD